MATKEEYLEKLKAQLDSWEGEIAELEVKAKEATAELKTEIEEQIGSLRVKFREGEMKFDEMMSLSDEKWAELKEDAEEVVDKLVDEFKDDIEYATTEAKGLVDKIKSLFS